MLIKKEHIKGLDINQDVFFVSDRILQINLRIQGSTLSIISVCAPTNVSEIEQKLEFYDQLQEITTNVSEKFVVHLWGYQCESWPYKQHRKQTEWNT